MKGDSSNEEGIFGMPCTRPRSGQTKLLFAPKSWCRYICPVLKLAATQEITSRARARSCFSSGHQNRGMFQVFYKKQLNKLQKGSESAFSNQGARAEVGLYCKKDGT